uniref:Peptidase_M14 domain-containing protein n=1 Tax=Trichuris muris TaxID=70415 RepID=A0A5S6QDS6_TRIMR
MVSSTPVASVKRRAVFWYTLWLIALRALGLQHSETERQHLLHVRPASIAQAEILNGLRRNDAVEVDFLKPYVKVGSSVRILVTEKSIPLVATILNSSGIEFADKTDELVKFLDHQANMVKNHEPINYQNSSDFFSFQTYHTLDEIYGFLKRVHRQFPNITELVKIGTSYEGRDMLAIRVGSDRSNKIIWVDAGMHAREWIGPATAVFLINELTESYGRKPVTTQLVNKFNFYILPVLNPDGYDYSWTTNRLWRKSRSKCDCTFDACCFGVDLNRNFPFAYEANLNPCRSDYAGPRYLSEPETMAMDRFFTQNHGRVALYLTLHAYGQFLEMPYGMESSEPVNLPKLMHIGRNFIEGAALYGQRYYLISTYNHVPIAGQAIDWAMFTKEVPFAFSLLQRPYEDDDSGFLLAKEQILPASMEVCEGLIAMAEKLEHYENSTSVE